MTLEEDYGRKLRRARHECELTLARAGKLLHTDGATVCRWEHGERTPPSPVLVAEAFGIPADVLCGPCPACSDSPPRGFQCLRCGESAPAPEVKG